MHRPNLIGLVLLVLVALPLCALAQSVEVKTGSGDTSVKAGSEGVSVKAGDTKVEIKDGKLSIVIGRSAKKVKLSESKPVVLDCKGNQDKTLRNLYIKAKIGDGIKVAGNCDLIIVDSYIEVTGFAIRASGNSDVVVKNSTIIGRQGAVYVGGNADVKVSGSRVEGKIVKTANGDFEIDDDEDE
ncbi:MAG: right-handed parallel beta-helix repeat-containing protein [Deltaproteobacteria bacterium]|nr:right-handed parallel beta-helix repeat-containing protein [Deltaproteobacteria bacterium]MBW1873077.1 right-handed parallel beta-helix repeat-containing protein [Deltaproteobacteria bacterium]